MNLKLTQRDSARASDHRARRRPVAPLPAPKLVDAAWPLVPSETVRVKYRDVGQLPPMDLEDEVGGSMTAQGRVVTAAEHACMDAIERACETDNEGGR